MLPFIDRHLSMHFKHISLTFSATMQNVIIPVPMLRKPEPREAK